ncbi:putative F-box/LRR-repeat protein At3g59160 [Papaver somniferum]|uniref:putative F-box/LRR-repeat protein At3g59160 n=1 Tax=Papaver somniferum TaxID=3469 RepID=UPI000E702D21|nr:putative F-box/LRR-repeat protein At3g59160 [Papaver somniferum]
MGVAEDRISELYDPLIHHIFSFLPIKCVIATSVLSKRWKDLWISAPVINICKWSQKVKTEDEKRMLEDVRCEETDGLGNSLDRMLLFPTSAVPNDILPTIKKFYLKFRAFDEHENNRFFNNDRICGWISTLIMRKVEELSLCLTKNFLLPPCLFTSETLTMLEIEMAGDLSTKIKKTGTLGFPRAISFPRLKILHLKHMVFVDESLNAQLFSSCPVLEELLLSHCYMMKKKVLQISVASLMRLFITNSEKFSFKIKIYSPNLQSLTYIGIPRDYVLMDHSFSSLVDADINIAVQFLSLRSKGRQAYQCGLKNLLGGISNAKLLKISDSTLEVLTYVVVYLLASLSYVKVSSLHDRLPFTILRFTT